METPVMTGAGEYRASGEIIQSWAGAVTLSVCLCGGHLTALGVFIPGILRGFGITAALTLAVSSLACRGLFFLLPGEYKKTAAP
jgi:hypothetical protein